MAAITFAPTPAKNGFGRGFWTDGNELLTKMINVLLETSSLNTGTNTVAEFQAAVQAAINME